ncbi:hypothetical protein NZK35_04620 [Stieleria sp. ICT_E10.1]|uniref:hypothetical protein n=1 Tax=Stieleria sedimenti TaxID=2976331 RepID=UPI00217FCD07|nr:hypothetical protein [Stieleria sedimenti]MCS7465955.1 hypothetical protein [Stieleria sedimenti]
MPIASGVTCVFNNAGDEGQDPMRLIKRLARHTYTTDQATAMPRRIPHALAGR